MFPGNLAPVATDPAAIILGMTDLSAEDQKLVTLARATRARVGVSAGAAVRDTDGRTYAAATVDLGHCSCPAVQSCVAMAVASGSAGIDAVVAKHLGKVPIPGSAVECHVLRFEAEEAAGRRNKVGTVRIRRLAPASGHQDVGA